uniref:Uncharacterized protein n=1 Tax=Oryza barthii TaxID=65489 RepID=A0A0D3EYQ3_9ORYZ
MTARRTAPRGDDGVESPDDDGAESPGGDDAEEARGDDDAESRRRRRLLPPSLRCKLRPTSLLCSGRSAATDASHRASTRCRPPGIAWTSSGWLQWEKRRRGERGRRIDSRG